ncbi:hypothetical protein HDZ31DRAFT_81062 [Schizophyllum fasciatum]
MPYLSAIATGASCSNSPAPKAHAPDHSLLPIPPTPQIHPSHTNTMSDIEYSELSIAKNVVPLSWIELGRGNFRNSELVRALGRTYALTCIRLIEARVDFADGEPPNTRPRVRVPVGGLELQSASPAEEARTVAFLLDPRCAVDVRRAQKLTLVHEGDVEPAELTPAVAASLLRALHTTLTVLEIVSPWLNGRRMMGWSPLVLAPGVTNLRFSFCRRSDRRHAAEVLREVFRDLRADVALEELYVELSLPLEKAAKIQYLGEPPDEEEDDNDLCQGAKWQAFDLTFATKARFLKNFKMAEIRVFGEGANRLEGWLTGMKKRKCIKVTKD